MKEDKVKKCVEVNRDKGEIKKTKGEENVAEKKMEKIRRKGVVLVLVIRVVWGKGMNKIFLFSKLMKKNIYIRVMLSLKYYYNKF